MSNKFIRFETFYPPDAPSSGGSAVATPSGDLTKQAIEDYLSDDNDDKEIIPLEDKDDKDDKDDEEKKSDKKAREAKDKTLEKSKEDDKDDKEDDEEDDDELKEIEDDLEEPDDKKLELTTPARRRDILKKYPKLFEDFPYLEKAYYREQQFTQLLPTIDDAKEAVEAKDTLASFEKDLMDGNTETILLAAKNTDQNSFNKLVDNYMSTLYKVDEKAHTHVVGNTIKHTIMAMVRESKASDNEALRNAAQILNQFVFGSSTFEVPKTLSTDSDAKKDDKDSKLNEREQKFNQQRLESSTNDLNTKVNNAYKATIEANIDPKSSMTDYVRKNATREALENLESLISKDTRFKVLVDKLWEQAIKKDFDKNSTDTIKHAFISKAKTLLPSVIKKARNEALRGMNKRVVDDKNDDKDTNDTTPKRVRQEDDKPRSRNNSGQVPKGMTSLEYLMSDD